MDILKREVFLLLLSMFFHQGDATGGPIQHSNGLCIFPKNDKTTRETLLVWSTNCFSENATFLVSNDYSIYHIDSGKCFWPKNGKPSDPGDTGKFILKSNSCGRLKFRPSRNGFLEYYTRYSLKICIGEGRASQEPVEGDEVMFSKPACTRQESCQHLSYVYELTVAASSRDYRQIVCREGSLMQVTWAYVGTLEQVIPVKLGVPKCGVNTTTNVMGKKCNGRLTCYIHPNSNKFRKTCSRYFRNAYLVVRYSCIRGTKPAAPIEVTIRVLGMNKLKVTWSSQKTRMENPIDWYSVCWKTSTNDKKCNNGNITSSSIKLNHLESSTKYFVYVASHSCKGGIGNYSKPKIGITRAALIKQSNKLPSAENFEIFFGQLKPDDKYFQIIVKKQASKEQPPNDPDSYSNLRSYNEKSTANAPYITAELDRDYVTIKNIFTVGDGEHYSRSTNRKTRDFQFLNVKLEPGTYYSVFQRTFKNDDLYYNSEWMNVIQTADTKDTVQITKPDNKKTVSNEKYDTNEENKGGKSNDKNDGSNTAIIGAVCGGVVAVILIIVVLVIVLFRRKGWFRNNSSSEEKPVFQSQSVSHDVGQSDSVLGIQDQPEEPDVFINTVQTYFQNNIGTPDVVYAKPDKSAKKKFQEEENKKYANLTEVYNSKENLNDASISPDYVIDMGNNSGFKEEIKGMVPDVVYAKPDKSAKKKFEEEENNMYANLTDVNSEEDLSGIDIFTFPKYVEDMKESGNSGFKEEFEKLPVGQTFPWDVSKNSINVNKNRYGNIVTYNHSRVVLSGDENQDYINASFIDGIKPDVYIASQGPFQNTVNDFWRMIWEQDSNSIIALTNITEMGKIKCVQYWPEKESTFGKIHVKMLNAELFADYVIRNLSIEKDGVTKMVKQYHFTSWPDHGVPRCPTQLLAFRRRFKTLHAEGSSPIVVHCSAGVGRTGTFIGLDIVLERLETLHQKTINIYETINYLRTRRVNMIQTMEQYIFVHDAVLEYLLCGVTEIEAEKLRSEIQRLERKDQNKYLTGFELEFQKLQSVCPPLSEEECGMALRDENRARNRHPDIYPTENLRVVISGSGREYINATYVHGYTQSNAYIATQTPLPDTINDFWKMVFEKKATVIVMLNNLTEGKTVYPQYWPETMDHEKQYGDVFVKIVSCDSHGPIISRKFVVIRKTKSLPVEHTVRHVQFTQWPEDAVPSDNSDVMVLLESMEESQQNLKTMEEDQESLKTMEEGQQSSSIGVIIVHCSNGAYRTGTYLTLATQRERIMAEHVLDVFTSIKMMRGQRPQFVGNVDQYKFCYYAMLNFVESFETYENISKSVRN